jgi:peptide/nickel transport system substrate-binding protein
MDSQNYWSTNRLSRRTALRGAGLAGVGLAGAALIGCGDDENGGSPTPGGTTQPGTSPTAAPTGTMAPPATGEPRQGGTVGFNGSTFANNFNLITNWNEAVTGAGIHVYDRPITPRFDETGYVLEAAESVELPDDTTVVITLKEGLVYQDLPPVNGRAVLADDIVTMQDYARTEENAQDNSFHRNVIASEEATDDRTVVYRLHRPSAYLFSGTQLGDQKSQAIVPSELILGDFNNTPPVGSGPYQQGDFQLGVQYQYLRNPTYRLADQGMPYIDERTRYVIGTDNTALEAAFRSRQLTFWVYQPPPPEIVDRLESDLGDEIVVQEFASLGDYPQHISNARPYFDDIRVREAWYRWHNPDQFIDLASGGWGVVCPGLISAGLEPWQVDGAATEEYRRYDPEAARQLLDAAGFDFDQEYLLVAITSPHNATMQQIASQQMAEVGITNVRFGDAPFADWVAQWSGTGEYDFGIVTYVGYDTPQTPLRLNHSVSNNLNTSWAVNDDNIDALIEESEQLVDRDANIEKVREIQMELFKLYAHKKEAYSPIERAVYWPELKNWHEGSSPALYPAHGHYHAGAWIES